jgi:hypothetical protein
MATIYEVVNIERHTGKQEAGSMRIGCRYHIAHLVVGHKAILPHVDNPVKALVTSPVINIDSKDGNETIVFTTKNTTYTLRKVGDDLSQM